MTMPLWLASQPVQQLLHKLVDRLDAEEASGNESARSFMLHEKTWPALYCAERESDRENLWLQLEWLAQQGWFEVRLGKLQAPQADYERKPKLCKLDADRLRTATQRPQRTIGAKEQWRSAVQQQLHASDAIKQVIARYCIDIPGKSAAAVVARLNRLSGLAAEPLLLREVSAKLFWEQSKILDARERQQMVAILLGLEECPFPPMPVQLQIFLPQQGYDGVLFIENQTTFEQAIRSGDRKFAHLALIYAAGFKSSARRLRIRGGSSLYFSAAGDLSPAATDRIAHWLYQESCMPSWFWGDLDYAGMEILQTLRNSFADLTAWPAGYAPMHAALLNGAGHAPEMAGKALQKKVERTGCAYADRVLLPALHALGKFIDQEMA